MLQKIYTNGVLLTEHKKPYDKIVTSQNIIKEYKAFMF